MFLKELLERIFILHKCGACRDILNYEDRNDALCPKCALRYRKAKTVSCPTCGQSAVDCLCMPKPLVKRGALCLRKLYFYRADEERAAQNRMLYFIKVYPHKRVAQFVARELYGVLRSELAVLSATAENTVIVSVPRSGVARRLYGFDQAAFIGERLSEVSGIPYVGTIRRRFGGRAQKKLGKGKRFKNANGHFKINDPTDVSGKLVVLFDDVVTTGASMSACIEILKKAGASGIICLCMAQAHKNSVK